jgi:hypothetical protein
MFLSVITYLRKCNENCKKPLETQTHIFPHKDDRRGYTVIKQYLLEAELEVAYNSYSQPPTQVKSAVRSYSKLTSSSIMYQRITSKPYKDSDSTLFHVDAEQKVQ